MSQNFDLESGGATKTSTKIHHHRDGSKTVTKTTKPIPGNATVEEVTEEYSMIGHTTPEVVAQVAPVQPQVYDPKYQVPLQPAPQMQPQAPQVVINNSNSQNAIGGDVLRSSHATSSMICGIVGLFFFGFVLGPVAICLGVSAKKEISNNADGIDGDCQATTGIVLGVIDTVWWVILVIFLVASA